MATLELADRKSLRPDTLRSGSTVVSRPEVQLWWPAVGNCEIRL